MNEIKLNDVKNNMESPKPKKFEMDKLSKFLNLTTVDMKKLSGGGQNLNFSDILDDVTFIDPAQNDTLRVASYAKEPVSKSSNTTSFDIVDLNSQSIESPVDPKLKMKL
jgi:hypothetical protein